MHGLVWGTDNAGLLRGRIGRKVENPRVSHQVKKWAVLTIRQLNGPDSTGRVGPGLTMRPCDDRERGQETPGYGVQRLVTPRVRLTTGPCLHG